MQSGPLQGFQNQLSMRFITGQVLPAANKNTLRRGKNSWKCVERSCAVRLDQICSVVSTLRLVLQQCAQLEIGQQIQKHAEGCRQMPALVLFCPGERVAAARVCHHRMRVASASPHLSL